jgi:pyrimidine-specific ribonucleoside hydrolase
MSGKLDVVWDMETGDPDDFLTLLLLLGHPAVNLKAVTITPGTPAQVGLVRRALAWFGRDLPVGAFDLDHPKDCVSAWHYRVYGEAPLSRDAEPGAAVLLRECDERTTLVTGAPPKNLGAAVEHGSLVLGRWVAQGGFAGEGVVPLERQLPKFRGRVTCPSYNLDGAPRAVRVALAAPGIRARRFVSKNVCHGVVYDEPLHAAVAAVKDASLALRLIWHGMEAYLRNNRSGKKLHDPLAACVAIDESIATWAEVELFRDRAGWGARLAPGSGVSIITGYDHHRFIEVLTAH